MTTTLVTGAAGFIGSHLCDELLRQGDTVIGLDDLSTGRRQNLIAAFEHRCFEFVEASTTDVGLIEDAVARVDRVAHLASPVGVARVMNSPLSTFESSLIGSLTLTEVVAARAIPLLVTSSSEIYGKNDTMPLTEKSDRVLGSPQSPRWSYSTAKAATEILALERSAAAGARAVVARLFNVVGPRQVGDHGMVLPRFVKAALAGEPLRVFGDGSQTRTFLEVSDAVRALVLLLDPANDRTNGQVFNVGSEVEISIADLARCVIEVCNSQSLVNFVPSVNEYGVTFEDPPRRVPSTERLRHVTDWRPTMDLAATIRGVADSC